VAPSMNEDDTSITTSFELVIIFYIISANLFALLFHFLLIRPNDVRMTTFYSSAALKKNINARSLQGCRGYGDSHGDSHGYGYGMGMGTVMNPHGFCG